MNEKKGKMISLTIIPPAFPASGESCGSSPQDDTLASLSNYP